MTIYEFSDRLKKLPPYLFDEIDKLKQEAIAQGADIVDLGIGDPIESTYPPIIEKLRLACEDKNTHRYPSYRGLMAFRDSAAKFYKRKFDVEVDPSSEILTLIGSKEGIGHLPLAFVNPGDYVLVPDPGYPVYNSGTLFAGGKPIWMPLLVENDFFPDFDEIEKKLPENCKLMWLSYPNNPTTAIANLDFFKKAVDFALKHEIIICHDAAYTEISFNGYKAPSILQIPDAKKCAVEFQSMSKTFNMTGWRIAFIVGNENLINGLAKVKVNIDSGTSTAIQYAAIEALNSCQSYVQEQIKIYEKRREILISSLKSSGFQFKVPDATIYLWVHIPEGFTSESFVKYLIQEKKLIVSPGNGFGKHGEGFFRISLTSDDENIKKAAERFSEINL